jgi:hypothetical protein
MKRILVFLFTVAPFVAGAIPASSARHDMRMLWMALVATIVAQVGAATMSRRPVHWSVIAVFLAAVIAAMIVAVLLGARSLPALGAVAVVLAGSATIGAVLARTSRIAVYREGA